MPSFRDIYRKYLTKEDVTPSRILTIKGAAPETVGREDSAEEKLVLYFEEDGRGVVLNQTRAEAVSDIAGTDDYEKWPGVRVEAFVDPTVKYAGKRVGGIAFRKPQ